MVANLIPYKGHAELIEAFARVAVGDARIKLFLIGEDRGIAQGLVSNANRLGIASKIDFMGQRNDVPTLLSAMDLGVMSSHEEGFSNALLEKLAAGLPVVATNVGGNPEALEGMPDCILVRPQDVDDLARGLADAVGRLSAGDQNRKIRQGRIRERYSVDAMVDAYERLYLRAQ
jgi:glycosyltransferase involved in cell wall biosynthesis